MVIYPGFHINLPSRHTFTFHQQRPSKTLQRIVPANTRTPIKLLPFRKKTIPMFHVLFVLSAAARTIKKGRLGGTINGVFFCWWKGDGPVLVLNYEFGVRDWNERGVCCDLGKWTQCGDNGVVQESAYPVIVGLGFGYIMVGGSWFVLSQMSDVKNEEEWLEKIRCLTFNIFGFILTKYCFSYCIILSSLDLSYLCKWYKKNLFVWFLNGPYSMKFWCKYFFTRWRLVDITKL